MSEFVSLNTGAKMPLIGFGTWQSAGDEFETVIETALAVGYRHIDTAAIYNNEDIIGQVLNKWLTSDKLTREDLFITTKLPVYGNRPELVKKYLDQSLEKLQLDYVDLYLIHAPFGIIESQENGIGIGVPDMSTDLASLWAEMEIQMDAGKTKAIGVSNFNQKQMERLLCTARIQPAVLQVELHVYLQQKELVQFCKDNNIVLTAYSPLGSRGSFKTFLTNKAIPDMFENEVIGTVANNHNKAPAQILLRYLVQRDIVVIPKSNNADRMKQNFEIFDFTLTEEEMDCISDLDKGEEGRILFFSEFFKGSEKHPEYPFSR